MCYCCRKLDKLVIFCTFEADSVSEPIRQLYIWGRICLSQSDSCTFEAKKIGLKCTYIWCRFGTFQAELIYFVMWCVWANQTAQTAVHLRPIWEKIGLKCTESIQPQMYRTASNVRTIDRWDQMCHKSLISCCCCWCCVNCWPFQNRDCRLRTYIYPTEIPCWNEEVQFFTFYSCTKCKWILDKQRKLLFNLIRSTI